MLPQPFSHSARFQNMTHFIQKLTLYFHISSLISRLTRTVNMFLTEFLIEHILPKQLVEDCPEYPEKLAKRLYQHLNSLNFNSDAVCAFLELKITEEHPISDSKNPEVKEACEKLRDIYRSRAEPFIDDYGNPLYNWCSRIENVLLDKEGPLLLPQHIKLEDPHRLPGLKRWILPLALIGAFVKDQKPAINEMVGAAIDVAGKDLANEVTAFI